MPYWEHLDLDEKTQKALRFKDAEKKHKKIFLATSLLIILITTSCLFYFKVISSQAFELIFSAIIGGFIGSSISFLVKEN